MTALDGTGLLQGRVVFLLHRRLLISLRLFAIVDVYLGRFEQRKRARRARFFVSRREHACEKPPEKKDF